MRVATRRETVRCRLAERPSEIMSGMASHAGARIGRPSKGVRRTRYSRIPVDLDGLVEAEAERTGLPISDVIANAVAAYYGREPVAEAPRPASQMQLTA